MEMMPLVSVAVALFAGLMMTRLFKVLGWNFPDVTAFLIAGLLIGPYGLGRIAAFGIGFPSYEYIDTLSILSDAALGFIAFSIGSEFRLKNIREI